MLLSSLNCTGYQHTPSVDFLALHRYQLRRVTKKRPKLEQFFMTSRVKQFSQFRNHGCTFLRVVYTALLTMWENGQSSHPITVIPINTALLRKLWCDQTQTQSTDLYHVDMHSAYFSGHIDQRVKLAHPVTVFKFGHWFFPFCCMKVWISPFRS